MLFRSRARVLIPGVAPCHPKKFPSLPLLPALHADAFPADKSADVNVHARAEMCARHRQIVRLPDCQTAGLPDRHIGILLNCTAFLAVWRESHSVAGQAKTGEYGNTGMARPSYPALCGHLARCRRRKQSREAAVPNREGRLSDKGRLGLL